MNEKPVQRKARQYFDTVADPSHITFDDGKEDWRNFPWSLFVGARWQYSEPDFLRVEIGDTIVMLRGHNLGPLKQAIEEHTLLRVRSRPELEEDLANEPDSFVTKIVFRSAPPKGEQTKAGAQLEIELSG